MVPKPGGGARPWGIPTIRDQVAQMAVRLIIELIFEADLEPMAYGYRPQRGAQDVLKEVQARCVRAAPKWWTPTCPVTLNPYPTGN